MTTRAHSTTSISRDWSQALQEFWELAAQSRISEVEWERIVDWISSTTFDGRNFAAGELAATLLRDRAPEAVRSRAAAGLDGNCDYGRHLYEVIMNGKTSGLVPAECKI